MFSHIFRAQEILLLEQQCQSYDPNWMHKLIKCMTLNALRNTKLKLNEWNAFKWNYFWFISSRFDSVPVHLGVFPLCCFDVVFLKILLKRAHKTCLSDYWLFHIFAFTGQFQLCFLALFCGTCRDNIFSFPNVSWFDYRSA